MKHRCGCQSTRTKGRSLAQAAGFDRKLVSERLFLCDCRSRRLEGAGKQVVPLRNALFKATSKAAGSSFTALLVWPVLEMEGLPHGSSPLRENRDESYLVDPASSHMLVSKIKPCMSKYKLLYCETANGSLNQLSSI